MAAHLFVLFTLDGAGIVPDLADYDTWLAAALWPGALATENLSYDAMAKSVKKHFDACEIYVVKVTHAFRMASARFLDEDNLPDTVGI